MELRVLGPIEVRDPDLRPIGGLVQRRALAMLALRAGGVVSVDQLVDGIWPNGDTPARADHNVRTYVHRLRTTIGDDRIETVGSDYRLRVGRDEFDVFRFEDLVDEARTAAGRGEPARAHDLLGEATALWRGDPYVDVVDHDWARTEIARLGELRASAVEHLMQASLDAGRHTEIIGSLQEAVADEPLRERRRAQLALALYRAGRQAEALRAIQDSRVDLADEFGLDPSTDLDDLEHRILEHDPGLLPASHQRHVLRGYELDEVIGEGAFSLVWRGMQPALNRTVAVKQIRAELANQPDFIRRFETEAQTVASLEHPFIVPLYDYWREPDNAYLVMRYVPTGTLESEVLQGGLDDTRLRRLVEQVGSALQAAHRTGVIHRDVKSANVLIDDEGNFFLTDFGVAFTGSVVDDELANALSTGSPAYASPEQLRRQSLDHRTDIYGFGITLFEAATGRLPFVDAPSQAAIVQRQLEDPVPAPSSVAPSVPGWVDDVVARATAKNPADRFGSMVELMAAVPPDATADTDRSRGIAPATVIGELANPFKALRAFREADSADFYGRDRLVARFADVLSRPGTAGRLLAVVGPSGSGKSSAVRSGLMPKLRAGAVPGSSEWFITTMLPGSRPFEELESALSRVAVRQPGPLVEMMRGDERGIARAISQILPDEESEVLLVIDQFEEMFTHAVDDERSRFLDGLLEAVREPRARLRVVVTIRADFWDRPLRHPGLAARLETAAVTVSPLAADELEAVIVEPVRRQGAQYAPGLVARIIADVGDQPGALPLLQYALTELFDANVSGLIRTESYDEIGGLTGALAKRAEETLAAMPPDEQIVARRLFGRLVTLGEGTEDTRRRVRLAELGDSLVAIIDGFGDPRLLVFDRDPITREPTVEIAHEALLQAWPRLRSWLDDDRDGLRIHRHLTDTAAAWLASGRDHGELYRGGRLESASSWAADHRSDLNADETEFLDASVAVHEAEKTAEREHLENQERSNRRLRILTTIATVVAVIAAVAGVVALRERNRANDQADEAQDQATEADQARAQAERIAFDAETARLVAQSASFAESNPRLAALLAVAARDRAATPETLGSVQTALVGAAPLLGHVGWGHGDYVDIEFLANERIVAVRADGLDLYDRVTGELLDSYEASIAISAAPGRIAAVFNRSRVGSSTDQHLVAVADKSGSVIALDVDDSFTVRNRWPLDAEPLHVTVDPAGERIAATDADWNLHVWSSDGTEVFVDRRGPLPATLWEQLEPVFDSDWPFRGYAESFAPQIGVSFVGDDLFVADGAYVSLLSAGGETLSGPTLPILEFAPEVFLVAAGETAIAADGTLQVYGIDSVFSLPLDEPWPTEIVASYLPGLGGGGSDSIAGVMPGDEGTIVVTDKGALFSVVGESAASQIVEAQGLNATSAARMGSEWAIATSEGIVVMSELAASPLARAFARPPSSTSATVSRNGDLVVAGPPGAPGVPAIWETASGRLVTPEPDLASSYFAGVPPMLLEELSLFGFEEDGDHVALLFVIDGGQLEFKATIPDPGAGAGGDGRGEVAAFLSDFVNIVTSDTWEILETLPEPIDPSDAAFHPTKDWLLAGSVTTPPVLYDTSTWEPVAGIDVSGESIALANWSLDGELLATAAFGESITIRDGETFELIHEMDLPSVDSEKWNDAALIFSEDNSLLLTNVDGVGRLWDVASGEPIGRPFPNEGGNSGVNWGALPQLVTVNDRAVLHWNLDSSSWRGLACTFAGSNLTPTEWRQWGPRDQAQETLCAEWPDVTE